MSESVSCQLGTCKECNMKQRLDFCIESTSAQVIILHKMEEVNKMAHVNIIGIDMLQRIAGTESGDNVTQEMLLGACNISSITVARNTKIVTDCCD